MPLVDLSGKRAERQAQILQMMNTMRNRSAGRASALDELNKEYEELDRKNREEARKAAESAARERNIQSEIQTREQDTALKTWQAGEKSSLDWRKDIREQQDLESVTGLRGAQKEEAGARTGLVKEQTKGAVEDTATKRQKRIQEHDEALTKHTNDQWNMGVQYLQSGNPEALAKDNVDQLEKVGRLKFGSTFRLPRLPDGSLDQQKAGNFLYTMTDKSGEPSGEFGKDIKSIEKPLNQFEANVRNWQDAVTRGKPEEAKWYGQKLWSDVQPTVGKVQGALLKQMFDDGDVDGIKQTLPGFRKSGGLAAAKAAGLPPAEARQRTEDGISTLGQINRIEQQFNDLVKNSPLPPTGRLVIPVYDFWASIQHSNPEVQAFRANLKDTVAQYRKFITGKASNEKEMADLLQAVPNEYDDVKSFTKKLAEMRWKTTRRIRTDLGMQQAYGLKLPDEVANLGPDFEPIRPSEAIKKWGLPDLNTDSGQKMWRAGELDKGIQATGDAIRRSGQQIAGPTEFRNKGGQLGQSIDPQAFQEYYNNLPPNMKPVFEAMSPDDQVRAMQGTLK